jgi:hypothetical protein
MKKVNVNIVKVGDLTGVPIVERNSAMTIYLRTNITACTYLKKMLYLM